MPSSASSTRRRLGLALVSGLLLVAVSAGSALASPGSAGPDTSDRPTPPFLLNADDGATPAMPNPAVTGAQPIPFDHVNVSSDGRTLTIYYWHGVEGCYGLKDVTVTPVDGGYAITVWAGMLPEAVSRICVDIAKFYSVEVTLDQPVFTSGGLD